MRFAWHIEPEDIAKVQAFVNLHCNDAFVRQRIAKNLSKQKPPVSGGGILGMPGGLSLDDPAEVWTQEQSDPIHRNAAISAAIRGVHVPPGRPARLRA